MCTVFTTMPDSSRYATSSAKRMPSVCTHRHFRSTRAPSIPSRPTRPRPLSRRCVTDSHEANTRPSLTNHAIASALHVSGHYDARPMAIPAGFERPPQRSFKPRRRGLSPTRTVAFERAMTRWGIAVAGPALRWPDLFDHASSGDPAVVLDIGFGAGEALIELAETRPDEHVIGIDVHTPGIAAVLDAVESRALRNVRVVDGDVLDFVGRIPDGSLSAIRAFFPDPWPKHRQRGRRLIRHDVVARLVPLLRSNGELQLASDAADYVAQMQTVCDAHRALHGGVVERPSWRPRTRFEQRGFDAGRAPLDLLYIASASSPSDSSSALR